MPFVTVRESTLLKVVMAASSGHASYGPVMYRIFSHSGKFSESDAVAFVEDVSAILDSVGHLSQSQCVVLSQRYGLTFDATADCISEISGQPGEVWCISDHECTSEDSDEDIDDDSKAQI